MFKIMLKIIYYKMKGNIKKTLKKKAKSFFQKINIFYVKISKYKWVLKT